MMISSSKKQWFHHLPLLMTLILSSAQGYQYGRECGVLYSEDNFSGATLSLMDNDQSMHLAEDYRARGSQSGWNSTRSFLVHKGCVLGACNDTYFDGYCQLFETGKYGVDMEAMGAASVKCSCHRVCECSDIKMRWRECARGYLAGGCSTCNAVYTDLRGKNEQIDAEFSSSITAFTVREGCSLKIYDDVDFRGNETIITDPIVSNFSGLVKSQMCSCGERPAPPPPPPPANEKYPPLVEVPSNLDNLTLLLRGEYRDHPGLVAALNSLNSNPDKRRSTRNAYILVLGYTGSGKSSAINILFDNPNLTRVGGVNSTTSEIHEFRISLPVAELGLSNSELRVIDTPGFGDTRGLEHDAKVLATLDSYLSSHEELSSRIPNIVLIFHKFHDNRFMGPGSKFVQMLAGLSSFRERLMDESYSNVIFVLSHFCSETKSVQRRPDGKLSQFKSVIESYSVLPRPTILTVAENKADEQQLPMVNGYHKLPNGEYYPRNLFDKLDMVTANTGDDIGRAVFRTAFRTGNTFENISRLDYSLVDENENIPKVVDYLNVLTRIIFDVRNTTVSALLAEAGESMSPELRSSFPHAVQYLQKFVNVWGIHEKHQIPKSSSSILRLLSHLEQNEATLYLLQKGLGISPPPFPSSVGAGQSYDIFSDRFILPTTTATSLPPPIFKGMDEELHPSDIGFLVPAGISCKKYLGSAQIFHMLGSREDYIRRRLGDLSVEVEGTPPEFFTGGVQPGYNVQPEALFAAGTNASKLTAVRELRLFQMELGSGAGLTAEFQEVVHSLGKFNSSIASSVARWNEFFEQYGTHVVGSLYGGGAIQVTLFSSSNKTSYFSDELARGLFELLQLGQDVNSMTSSSSLSSSNSSGKYLLEGVSHSLKFLGGDPSFQQTTSLSHLSMEEAAKLLSSWRKSLLYAPSLLTTEMRLIPMSKVVKAAMGREVADEVEKVSRLLLFHNNATTVVSDGRQGRLVPLPTPPPPPTPREDTEGMLALSRQMEESNRQVKELLSEIERLSRENALRSVEFEAARDKMEHETRMRMTEMQLQYEKRTADFIREISMRNRPQWVRPPVSCLKEGTPILMADWTTKEIQHVSPGDVVLDMELNPTAVMGVAYEFLQNQSFYGFSKEEQFFTNLHIWVGPGDTTSRDTTSGGGLKLYTKSVADLIRHNPLLEYLNVTQFEEGEVTRIFHVDDRRSLVEVEEVEVFRDPAIYPEDTKVYFMQVESPTGTYVANGYVTRHEIPPMHLWPHTMGALVQLLGHPIYEQSVQFEYTLDTAQMVDHVTDEIADAVKVMLEAEIEDGLLVKNLDDRSEKDLEVIPLTEEMGVESMRKLYNHPTYASIGVSTYSKVGPLVAPYLDGEGGFKDAAEVAYLQHRLVQVIEGKMPELLQLMLKWQSLKQESE